VVEVSAGKKVIERKLAEKERQVQELKHKCFELGWFQWNNGEWMAKADVVAKGYFDHKPVKYFDRRNRECWRPVLAPVTQPQSGAQ
jgi:hypothetical protein